MDYLILWTSLVMTATAVVISLVLWRRWRDRLLLAIFALLATVFLRSVLIAVEILRETAHGALDAWAELLIAVVALATVLATQRLLERGRQRQRTITRVEEALNEADRQGAVVGAEYFRRIVRTLAEILGVELAFLAELNADGKTADVLAVTVGGEDGELISYQLAGNPCGEVLSKQACVYPSKVREQFPDGPLLIDLEAEAYIGVPLLDANEKPLGVLAIVHTEPIEDSEAMVPAMRILARRVEGELERERKNRELRESESRYRALFEESLEARFVTDYEGRMTHVNQAAVELFGYDSREQVLAEFLAEDHYGSYTERDAVLEDLLRDGAVRDYPIEVKRCDGSMIATRATAVVEYDDDGRVGAIRTVLRDVSRERELQRQVMSSQRMEAIGLMAGGVAHDFNNMLTIINGHSDLLLDELGPDSSAAADVREIKSAAQSAAAFTRRLLLLSRRQVLAPSRVPLNQVMRDLSVLLERAVGRDVTLELDLESQVGDVIADSTEMEQVLLNLVMNSRDAMPDGGEVSITTRWVELGDWEALERGLDPGTWVELEVADDGLGMEPGVADRIFEPFFTTKDPTIGTGLGLSTVYGIVRQLGGDVAVRSKQGKGTTFSILMPPAPDTSAPESVIAPAKPKPGEQATLLVVDDEPSVRELLRRALERLGYDVVLAADGREALDSLKARGRVDLLISDMMMPGLHGDRLAELAREQQADLPVLLISGNSNQGELELTNGAPAAFLSKPFSAQELSDQVRQLLGRA